MAGKKRGNGEGSFSQLPSGKWRAQATIHGRRVGLTAKTHKEAQEGLRKLLSDADRGLMPPAEKLTLGVHIDRWLADVVTHSVRPSTRKNYADLTRLYIVPTLGGVKLTQLQPAHVQRLYSTLLDRGLAPKTVRNVHAALRRALKQAVDWNLCPRNVATLVEPPRIPRKEVEVLTPEEVRTLLTAVRGRRWEPLIATALATGMRFGELLGLRWGDVDLTRATIRVQRQLGQNGLVSEPKTAKGRRTIDLPASSVALLREHKRRQNEDRLLLGQGWEHGDFVFCSHQGKPLRQSNVLRAFKQELAAAGLADRAFHTLRHTAATLLLLQGVHPKVVQERLGHSNISMTLDTYSHLIPSMGRTAAEQLDALLA